MESVGDVLRLGEGAVPRGTATALTMYFGADDPEHPDPESAVFLPPSGSFANQKPAGD